MLLSSFIALPAPVIPKNAAVNTIRMPASEPESTVHPPVISDIEVGDRYIEIKADHPVRHFRSFRLNSPERLVIDIPGGRCSMPDKAVAVNRLGVATVRLGRYPDHIRIVFDAIGTTPTGYRISSSMNGLRVTF